MEPRDLKLKIFLKNKGSVARRAVESGSNKVWLWKLRIAQGQVARRADENSKGRNVTASCALRRHEICEI
ncbi:hypothetical protein A2U01_0063525 [Trifolium medium]|uniref:Uncharacterized protein n=1 Tax=Trifolium medium TaxID=97028 RepID=A0A392S092_9FABA|nr:hypothetical protein [Trifolium medium]